MSDPVRAVVVGAGLAGLAAAWRLREAGCRVEVLEARAQAGGRARGERIDGFSIERSLQVLRSNDRHLPGWIRSVGLADELLPLRPVVEAHFHAGRVSPFSARSPFEVSKLGGVRFHQAMRLLRLPRLMKRYGPLLDRDVPERAAAWDFRSVRDFARLYFGDSVEQYFIGPIASSANFGDPAESSRVVFLLEWLAAQSGRFGVARRGLSELPARAAERLGVRTRHEAVTIESAGPGYLVCSVDGGRFEADIVVLATAPGRAASLAAPFLAAAERDYFAAQRCDDEIVLSLALDRPASGASNYVRVPHAEGECIEAVLVEPGITDGRAPVGCGVATVVANRDFASSCAGADDEVVEKEMRAALERVFPSVVGTVRFARLYRRDAAIPRFEVGAFRALDRLRRVQQDRRRAGRRLYFAGDYLAGLAADVVVGSGLRAGAEALRDMGANGAAPVPPR